MDRNQVLLLLVQQAREHGFEFRKWFRTEAVRPWVSAEDAIEWLAQGNRANMLVFSHTFAKTFFRSGERLRYIRPASTYSRVRADGSVEAVQIKAHTRSSNRADVWRYHLSQMAAAPEPLRYIRKYLVLEETLAEHSAPKMPARRKSAEGAASTRLAAPPPPVETRTYDDELLVRDELAE